MFKLLRFLSYALCLALFSAAVAADEVKQIPLGAIYTTTHQKETRDLWTHLKDLPPGGVYGEPLRSERVVFLVNGKELNEAVRASRSFLVPADKAEAPAQTNGEDIWVGAHIGSRGSQPPAYRVLAVEVEGRTVRVIYETVKTTWSTMDYYSYLVWAPLGSLPAGDYRLELYDVAIKKVTATGASKVRAASASAAVTKELELFQGHWQARSLQSADGRMAPDEQARAMRLTVVGDRFMLSDKNFTVTGVFLIDPAKMPKTIDVVLDGAKSGEKFLGIYQIDGECRKSCFALPGAERPRDFRRGVAGTIQFEWERRPAE